jgi:AcrR family transcriptional regulator
MPRCAEQQTISDSAESPPPARAPALGRRERNKQEKLRRIITAAQGLFAERGFAQTTTQAIAEAADIGAGTLFLYVKSKEDLLIMVFRDEMAATSRAAVRAQTAEAPLLDQLMSVFGVMIDYHARDLDMARVLIKEISIPASAQTHAYIDSLMREIYAGLGGLIAAGQQRGRLRPDADPSMAAETLFGAYYLGLIAWLGGMTSRRRFVARLRRRLALIVDGLAIAPSP